MINRTRKQSHLPSSSTMADFNQAKKAPPAASAAAATSNDDALLAQKLYAVEQLTSLYGFSMAVAEEAVDFISATMDDSADGAIDITACYNYILDANLASDQGGPIVPIETCPHVKHHVCITANQLPISPGNAVCTFVANESKNSESSNNTNGRAGRFKSDLEDGISCAATENWLCLECGVVRCSRYCNGHAVQHWHETQEQLQQQHENDDETKKQSATTSKLSNKDGAEEVATSRNAKKDDDNHDKTVGHCVMVSLSDLSVWCHVCNAYLSTSTTTSMTGRQLLQPLVQQLEALKFSTEDNDGNNGDIEMVVGSEPEPKKHKSETSDETADKVQEGEDDDDDEDEDEDYEENEDEEDGNEEDNDPVTEDLLRRLSELAEQRGIPLQWLVMQAIQEEEQEDEEDDADLEYPFDTLPTSLDDVAAFIQSDKCRSVIVLAGAGMSVSSGIPDFRSADGLYATLNADLLTADEAEREAIRAEPTVSLQQDMFLQNPYPCLELQREFILGTRRQQWKATLAHRFVELLHEKTGKLVRHYTQNIDGLEDQCSKLPREKVIAVHGSMDRAECARCLTEADFDEFCSSVQRQIKDLSGKDPQAPKESSPIVCKVCGYNAMKPAIVLFKSSLPKAFFENVPRDIQDVDLLIVIGTSLRVAPACSLVPQVPKTALRLLVNREQAGAHLGFVFDADASKRDYFAQGECDAVLLELMDRLGWIDDLKPLLQNNLLPASCAQLLEEHLDLQTKSSGK